MKQRERNQCRRSRAQRACGRAAARLAVRGPTTPALVRVWALFVALAAGLGAVREARAHCDAALLCPGSGDCAISNLSQANTKIDHGCVLDFAGRKVTLNATLDIDGNVVTIRARDFTVAPGGLIDGSPQGGAITIVATGGNILVQSSAQRGITVSSQSQGGAIVLEATGNVTIDGRLKANGTVPDASGGSIELLAGGNVRISGSSDVDVGGGRNTDGGMLDLSAVGRIDIEKDVSVSGGEGGEANLEAGDEILLIGRILNDSTGGGGGGGFVDIAAAKTITVGKSIQSKGSTTSGPDPFGGDGGSVRIGSDNGDVIVRGEISVRSGVPDGGGGEIEISAGRSVKLQAGELNARGEGSQSFAGGVFVDGDLDVSIGAPVDVSGGSGGGEIEIVAGRDAVIAHLLDVRGRQAESLAGSILVDAGVLEAGALTVKAGAVQAQAGRVFASGGGCQSGFCSAAGTIELSGCDVTVEGKPTPGSTVFPGVLDASAPGATGGGGAISIAARQQLTVGIAAKLDATGLGAQGTVELVFPKSMPPILGGALITPLTEASSIACTEANCAASCPPTDEICRACRPLCLEYCECGDGMTDEFEQCDRPHAGSCGAGQVCAVTGTSLQCRCIDTCGNGGVDAGEECDGVEGGSTCRALGFFDPDDPPTIVPCASCAFDFQTAGCTPGFCGDNVLAPRNELDEKSLPGFFEVCDGTDVGAESCVSLGFTRGTLACKADCSGFDVSDCEIGVCGDNVIDPGEECDAGNANSNAPNAPCRPGCLLPRCGDGVADTESGEECDDANKSDTDRCLNGCLLATCGDGIPCLAASCTSGPGGGREECDEVSNCCLSTCAQRRCPDGLACGDLGDNGCCHPDTSCDDGNRCTTDSACDPKAGCRHTLIVGCCAGPGAACDDGNACTTDDTCAGGTCAGTAVRCVSDDPCQEPAGCDPATGCEFRGIPGCCLENGDCADDDACTNERCDTATHACVAEQVQCVTTDRCLAVIGCDPQAGCRTARVNGTVGLDCLMERELLALTGEVPAKEPDLGKKLVKQLGKFLKKARKKIEKGRKLAGDPKKVAKAAKQLTAADKQLAKFLTKLEGVDPAVAGPLIELVRFIRGELARALE